MTGRCADAGAGTVTPVWAAARGRAAIDVSLVVPVFNECESLRPLYDLILETLEPLETRFEILIVDDGSADGSEAEACAIAAADSRVSVVRLRRNCGQTAAISAGIELSHGAFIVTMDGDLQNDPRDVPMMLAMAGSGYDLVVGWRANRQDRWLSRRLPSRVANWLIGRVTGVRIRDNGCSLKVYRADMIKHVPLYSDMHRFIPAMTAPFGARIGEVAVRHHGRRFGASKYGLSRISKVLIDLMAISAIRLFSRRPLALFSGFAGGSLGAAVILALLVGENGSSGVVEMAVFGLLASLAVFLFLLGLIVALVFQLSAAEASR